MTSLVFLFMPCEGVGRRHMYGSPSMTRATLWAAILLLLWSNPGFAQEQPGYRIDARKRQITVNTDKHWGQWLLGELDQPIDSVGQDVLELRVKDGGGDALLVPREFRRQVDALTDAPAFSHVIDARDEQQFINVLEGPRATGGVKNAGSNLALAEGAIDRGDDRFQTYWQPDLDEPSFKWWIEFDMGRLVSAEKIILRFVDEELGDPFLQFRVLVSTGLLRFDSKVRPLDYRTVGGTTRGIRDQREFAFDLEPDVKADPDFTGTPVQYVRIVVTDSNLDRAEEVTREVYENDLSPDSRGRIEYYLKSFDGDEVLTTPEVYETIETEEPDRLGSVRWYRRERPRLADVQVITTGDNIALGILERGGRLTYLGQGPGYPDKCFQRQLPGRMAFHAQHETGTTPGRRGWAAHRRSGSLVLGGRLPHSRATRKRPNTRSGGGRSGFRTVPRPRTVPRSGTGSRRLNGNATRPRTGSSMRRTVSNRFEPASSNSSTSTAPTRRCPRMSASANCRCSARAVSPGWFSLPP